MASSSTVHVEMSTKNDLKPNNLSIISVFILMDYVMFVYHIDSTHQHHVTWRQSHLSTTTTLGSTKWIDRAC